MSEQQQSSSPMPEQVAYANLLFLGCWAGIFILITTYFIYISGLLGAHVPIELVVNNWDKGVGEYLKITDSPVGWDWVGLLHSGDFLNFIGLALLATLTIFCYFILIPGYIKRGDKIYTTIAILEVLVLTVAASGILGSGGH